VEEERLVHRRLPGPRVRWQLARWAWKLVLGFIPGIVLLALLARGLDLNQLVRGIAQVDPLWGSLAFVSVLITTAAKIARWRGLWPGDAPPDWCGLGRSLLIGQCANALLPARLGDLLRVLVVGGEHVSRSMALGTVAAEKFLDVCSLLALAGLTVALGDWPWWVDLSLAGLVAVGLALLALILSSRGSWLQAWMDRWASRLPFGSGARLQGIAARCLVGLATIRQPRVALRASLWSVLIWALAASTNYVLFLAFSLWLPFKTALLLLIVLHVGVAPPSTPGKLGVFHSLTVLTLQSAHIDRPTSLAYAIVLYLIVYLPQIVPGAVLLSSYSFGSLSHLGRGPDRP
jgi:uncharacterized protein (TIRG00374 family)